MARSDARLASPYYFVASSRPAGKVAVLLDDLITQRWGVGSTILHRDAGALALGVLLFDRIVLPTPSDEPEADRWDSLGWDTEAQARRIVQLGELVYFAPWTEELRADWQTRWEHLRKIGTEARDLAFAATPQVIAMNAWSDVVASAGGVLRAPAPAGAGDLGIGTQWCHR